MGKWINIRPKVHIYALDEGAVFFVPTRLFVPIRLFMPIRLFVPVSLFVEAFCLIALLVGEVPQVEEGGP